ncbi:2-polyprenyl-6-methoxyphenol hydroxylase-like FAD-dependent oxidoreductase [Streptomyces sp. Amel2xB2]|uniref:FAD-dependent monooxygenase n=1 Tax=Streptomyces sp. Amel2xB2 TaxID=1305829 RepID=UPI000DC04D7F|nr:FAD-dependent monooxygenase [Streptomyces sp. Amel2xB2]RAJ66754.1 2-polyprenyl-6-methoxyphenol hydroxylase-like FAD-dependent oxidoreductase [Streptomyces sp. Amel2xB2]
MTAEDVDVVVAGAGPNGLMLACELSLAGVRPLVLERLPQRTSENRANGLIGQVTLMLDRRGLHERLSGSAELPQTRPVFAFGAMPLELHRLERNPLHGLGVPQLRIEEVLEERALELGVEIRRGHELAGLSQDEDGVSADVRGPAGTYGLRARFLVGADGGRSVTRKLAGIGFPGVTSDDAVHRSGHVRLPDWLSDPETGGLNVPGHGPVPPFLHYRTDHGLFVYAPFPGRPTMISATEWGEDRAGRGDEPMTLEELQASASRVLGAELPVEPPEGDGPHMLRRLDSGNTRLAERYRSGRVLLVGDAAHVHSAIGAPGLNLGLQDTVNLGWKLAAEVLGTAPPGLLDSYEAERRPVAERVVMHTQAQSALIAPGSEVTALRELFMELLEDPANVRRIGEMMAGADIRYAMGPETAHPLTGAWAPDVVVDAGDGPVRLAELTRSARPLLLDLSEDGDLADEVRAWGERVETVTARPAGPQDGASGTVGRNGDSGTDGSAPVTAMLLRPDCHLAWASSSARPGADERAELRAAAARWFGTGGAVALSPAAATGR